MSVFVLDIVTSFCSFSKTSGLSENVLIAVAYPLPSFECDAVDRNDEIGTVSPEMNLTGHCIDAFDRVRFPPITYPRRSGDPLLQGSRCTFPLGRITPAECGERSRHKSYRHHDDNSDLKQVEAPELVVNRQGLYPPSHCGVSLR